MNAEYRWDEDVREAPQERIPRIALMGEFSAGKSTLANLLLGQEVSPVQVTATQMPPVWYALGRPAARVIDGEGRESPISLDDLAAYTPTGTTAVRVFMEAEVLEFCDLIDMPGTSDPNMAQELWQDMLSEVDGVVWCTTATQAWRQSEAAIWEQMPPDLQARSLLLVTRMDKILTERDRARVVGRVEREAGALFRGVFPISLAEALAAREDEEVLRASGTEAFVDALIDLLREAGPQAVEAMPAEAEYDDEEWLDRDWQAAVPDDAGPVQQDEAERENIFD